MAKKILNHPDLNSEQLREFIRRCNSSIVPLHNTHRIVVEDIFEKLRNILCPLSRQQISTIIGHLDDAIALSFDLRSSFLADLKYHDECEKRKKRQRKKQTAQADNKQP